MGAVVLEAVTRVWTQESVCADSVLKRKKCHLTKHMLGGEGVGFLAILRLWVCNCCCWQWNELGYLFCFGILRHEICPNCVPQTEIISSSVSVNLIHLFFRTPLHLACANGHVDVVTYLVENKCKLNLFDNDNRSPLMKVCGMCYPTQSGAY